MAWFKNLKSGVFSTTEKRDTPINLWVQCDNCKETVYKKELDKTLSVCPHCGNHFRMGANEYIKMLLDEGSFQEMDANLETNDPLKFAAKKKYKDSLSAAQAKTGQKSGVLSGTGTLNGRTVSIAVMDFRFIGGSMGIVEGEKITRAFKKAVELNCPALVVCASGGARMQESSYSLMQMAKTSAWLAKMDEISLPYVAILTNPTTGGITASFAMLGDINIAEPKALIGFAGERVIRETIGQALPEGFQRSEFLLDHGFLDFITPRSEMKPKIDLMLSHFMD